MDAMEAMEEGENETVELLLMEKERFRVNKKKLMRTSGYFASLFTHNFSDSQLNECAINYNFAPCILQNFVDWVTEDPILGDDKDIASGKECMKKYIEGNYGDLLELLHFSVIFTVEQLQNDITDIIFRFWKVAEYFVDLFLLSKKLSLVELRNYAFATCIQRFSDIPNSKFKELPKDAVLQILCNKYLDDYVSSDKILEVIKSCGMDEKIPDLSLLRKASSNQKYLSCVVWFKNTDCVYEDSDPDEKGRKPSIYAWNGKEFFELVEVKELMPPGKDVFGMQVIGKGYSIYVIGGERGLGSGHFNMNIWRYCLLSKRWYFVTKLQRPRRHMAVAFLGNHLLLLGGVGRCRLKLSTLDIYDIHTDSWSKGGGRIPEEFTEVPPTWVVNDDTLLLLKSSLYAYLPKDDSWQCRDYSFTGLYTIESIFVSPYFPSHIYMGHVNESGNAVYGKREITNLESSGSRVEFPPNNVTITNGTITGFLHNHEEVSIHILDSDDICSKIYSERREDLHSSNNRAKLGCFTLFSPETLYPDVSSLLKEVL